MKFVAIIKTVAELAERKPEQTNLPNWYPVEMKEFEAHSLEVAKEAYPSAVILTTDEYRGFQVALGQIFEDAQVESKPWYKFW